MRIPLYHCTVPSVAVLEFDGCFFHLFKNYFRYTLIELHQIGYVVRAVTQHHFPLNHKSSVRHAVEPEHAQVVTSGVVSDHIQLMLCYCFKHSGGTTVSETYGVKPLLRYTVEHSIYFRDIHS